MAYEPLFITEASMEALEEEFNNGDRDAITVLRVALYFRDSFGSTAAAAAKVAEQTAKGWKVTYGDIDSITGANAHEMLAVDFDIVLDSAARTTDATPSTMLARLRKVTGQWLSRASLGRSTSASSNMLDALRLEELQRVFELVNDY